MDFISEHIAELLISLMVSLVLGGVATVRAFFSNLRKMQEKLNEIEQRLDANEDRDDKVAKWVEELIKQKMN